MFFVFNFGFEMKRRGSARWLLACVAACAFALALVGGDQTLWAQDLSTLPAARIGMPVRVEGLVLPGGELEVAPIDDETPLVIRLAAVSPHGSAFRYDLEYYGLEAGKYELGDFLRRKAGGPVEGLPELPVKILAELPAGHVTPHELAFQRLPWLGGYRVLLILAAVVWAAGLAWLIWPRRRAVDDPGEIEAPPLSLADRLRPLVRAASAGELPPAQLAELERALVSYWLQRLNLEGLPPDAALRVLREHEEAGPLVNRLEDWLHRPAPVAVDVAALLAPYQNLPSDALKPVGAGEGKAGV